MVSLPASPLLLVNRDLNSTLIPLTRKSRPRMYRPLVMSASSEDDNYNVNSSQNSTRLITFLGKGGSGKTTSAVFASQHYAMAGLNTCLVVQTQDPTAEYLLGCKIGTSPIRCSNNLSVVRLETTKLLLEPLNWLKQADARLNMTQGVLEGVVGEELGVLLGMDSVFSAFALERLVGFLGNLAQRNHQKDKFDIVVYDGISTEETLRMIGATSKGRLYMKHLRSITEKTDLGRLAGPSILRLVDEALSISTNRSPLNGKVSAEIWDTVEHLLERGASAFSEPSKFGCFLVMDPSSITSVNSALRYWGCIIQAGAQVSGAVALGSTQLKVESMEKLKKKFSPLPVAFIPHIPMSTPLDWNATILNNDSQNARDLLSLPMSHSCTKIPTVKFDAAKKSVTLLMPGFDKSEIKLYQYRGGSELLVEAGDQRRVISLPPQIQGKVGGAKFIDRSIVITMR